MSIRQAKEIFLQHYSKIYFWSLVLVEATLFLPIKYNFYAIIIFFIPWSINFVIRREKFFLEKQFWLIAGFYILFLIGMTYTTNINQGLKELETRSAMLFIPIVIFTTTQIKEHVKENLLLYFSNISLITGLVLIAIACFNYYLTNDINFFYAENFTKINKFNYVNLSQFILFGMCCRFIIIRKRNNYNRIFFWACNLFGFLLLFMLSSKTTLLLAMVILVIFILTNGQKSISQRIIGFVFLLCIIISAFVFFGITKERFLDITNSKLEILTKESYAYNEEFNGLTLRLVFWKLSIKHSILDKHYFGAGTGSTTDYLNSIYAKYGLLDAGYINFNAHNEYIETFLTLGFPGLLYLLFLFCYGFRKGVGEKNTLFILFLIIVAVGSLTESVLTVNKGIIFFTFFYSIFINSSPENKSKPIIG